MPRMKVAVKVLKTEGLTPSIRQQFIDEANTMAQLADHPYIVQVFRAGTSEDGRPYLVMKYYPPPNLAQRARAAQFSVEEVLRTGIQLSSAVETAHRVGVIHRDIKPANVLVSQYGSPGLTDFGIAGRGGALEELDDDIGVSIPWAPPEVLFGQSNGDTRADVYALAATLWQLLIGRSPFEVPGGDNSTYALMPRIRSNPPPSTARADVPTSLERLLAQAMSKNPLARPARAIEFARSLQQIEQEERFSRTAIVVLDELGLPGDSGAVSGQTQDRTRLRTNSGSGPRPTPGAPPPPLGQPVIGGQLSGGRSIGAVPPVPIADGVTERPRSSAPPNASGQPPPPTGPSGPRPSMAPNPPMGSGPRPPQASGPPPAAPPKGGVPWLPIVAGLLLVIGIVSAAFALTRDGGGGGGTDPRGVELTGVPSLDAEPKSGQVVFTATYPDFAEGDGYAIMTAPTKDNFGPATAVTIPDVDDSTGMGRYPLTVGSGSQQCGKARVIRGDERSAWSEIVCETGTQ